VRVAADARGVAREIFAGSSCAAHAWRACFAGEKDHVVFDDRRALCDGFAGGSCNHFGFEMRLLFTVLGFRVFRVGMIGF